jgi:hypothetical protein
MTPFLSTLHWLAGAAVALALSAVFLLIGLVRWVNKRNPHLFEDDIYEDDDPNE